MLTRRLPPKLSRLALLLLPRLVRAIPIILLLLTLLGAVWLIALPARLPSPQQLQRRNGLDLDEIEGFLKRSEEQPPVNPGELRDPFQPPSLTND